MAAPPPFEHVQLDCSISRLFSQLVSLKLAEIMNHSDEDVVWSGYEHFPSMSESLERCASWGRVHCSIKKEVLDLVY
jgi:hypothetical protein